MTIEIDSRVKTGAEHEDYNAEQPFGIKGTHYKLKTSWSKNNNR